MTVDHVHFSTYVLSIQERSKVFRLRTAPLERHERAPPVHVPIVRCHGETHVTWLTRAPQPWILTSQALLKASFHCKHLSTPDQPQDLPPSLLFSRSLNKLFLTFDTMLAALIFIALVGYCSAQGALPCGKSQQTRGWLPSKYEASLVLPCTDSPPQWEAHYSLFDPVEGHEFSVYGRYHYDKTNLRKARFEEIDEGRNTSHRYLEVIELYREVSRYSMYWSHNQIMVPLMKLSAAYNVDWKKQSQSTYGRVLFLAIRYTLKIEEDSPLLKAALQDQITRRYWSSPLQLKYSISDSQR